MFVRQGQRASSQATGTKMATAAAQVQLQPHSLASHTVREAKNHGFP